MSNDYPSWVDIGSRSAIVKILDFRSWGKDKDEITIDGLIVTLTLMKEFGFEYTGYHYDTGYYNSLEEFSMEFDIPKDSVMINGYYLINNGWTRKASVYTKGENTITYDGWLWLLNGVRIYTINDIP